MAKQRANGLSVIVFIILRVTGDYTSQILGTPLPDNYKISLRCSDTDRDAIGFMITVICTKCLRVFGAESRNLKFSKSDAKLTGYRLIHGRSRRLVRVEQSRRYS